MLSAISCCSAEFSNSQYILFALSLKSAMDKLFKNLLVRTVNVWHLHCMMEKKWHGRTLYW